MLLLASSSSHAQSKSIAFDGFLGFVVGGGTSQKDLGDGGTFGAAISYGEVLKKHKIYLGAELRGMKELISHRGLTGELSFGELSFGGVSLGEVSFDYSLAVHARIGAPIKDDLLWVLALGYENMFIHFDIPAEGIFPAINDGDSAHAFSIGTEFVYTVDNFFFMNLGYYTHIAEGQNFELKDNDGGPVKIFFDDYIAYRFLFGVGYKF